jgi:hypothetical protein
MREMSMRLMALVVLLAAVNATAQERPSGQVARSAVGQAGQRQTRQDVTSDVEPMARISNRIQNRVQSRIRNRVDSFYDPQSNATSPFEIASEQARTTGRPSRR